MTHERLDRFYVPACVGGIHILNLKPVWKGGEGGGGGGRLRERKVAVGDL